MTDKIISLRLPKRAIGVLLSLLAVLCFLPVPAAASPVTPEQPITVTFSAREYITNSHYFKEVPFSYEELPDFGELMASAKESGLIREYLFEGDMLQSVTFLNGTTLQKGAYGKESDFRLVFEGLSYPANALLPLVSGKHYTLQYKIKESDTGGFLTGVETDVSQHLIWDESWDAVLDSACDWLYYNRTRGSKQAVTALGVAARPANPTDVVLLTQMVGVDTEDLSSLISVVYACAYSGYSHPRVGSEDLFYKIQNYSDPQACTTKQLCDILRLYDAFSFEIDTTVRLSRGAIVKELLERVNDDGGFCPRPWRGSDIEASANAIAALQEYRDLRAVDTAVVDGISYLSSPEVRDKLFSTEEPVSSTVVSRVIIAMSCCGLPYHDVYFTKDGMTYADLLLQYLSVSGGFSIKPGENEEEEATAAAVIAMCALREKSDPYRQDTLLVPLHAVVEDQTVLKPIDPIPAGEGKLFPQIKGGFWLALGSVAAAIVIQFIRYLRKKNKEKAARLQSEQS